MRSWLLAGTAFVAVPAYAQVANTNVDLSPRDFHAWRNMWLPSGQQLNAIGAGCSLSSGTLSCSGSGSAPPNSPLLGGTGSAFSSVSPDNTTLVETGTGPYTLGVGTVPVAKVSGAVATTGANSLTGTYSGGTFSGGDVSAETASITRFGLSLSQQMSDLARDAVQLDITSSRYWIWPATPTTRVDEVQAFNDVKQQANNLWNNKGVLACIYIPSGIDTSGVGTLGTGPTGIVLGGGSTGIAQNAANTPLCIHGAQLGNSRIVFDPAVFGQSGPFGTQGAFFDPHFDGSHVPWGTLWNATLQLPTGQIYAGSYLADIQMVGPGIGSSSGVTTQPQIDAWGLNAYTVIERVRVTHQRGGCMRLGYSPGDPNSTADGNANATNYPGGFLESAVIDDWCIQTGDATPHAQSDPYSTGTLTTLGNDTPSVWLTSISGTKAGSNTVYIHNLSILQGRGKCLLVDAYPQKTGGGTRGIVFGGLTRVEHCAEDATGANGIEANVQVGNLDSSVTVGTTNVQQVAKISFDNIFTPTPPNGGYAVYVPARAADTVSTAPSNINLRDVQITSGNRGQGDGWFLQGRDIRMTVTQSVLTGQWFDGVFGEPSFWNPGGSSGADPTNVIVEGTNVNSWVIGQENASFTGSISSDGNTLTVSSVVYGTLHTTDTIRGYGVLQGETIASQISGTTGGVGTYALITGNGQSAISSEGMLDIGIPTTSAAADRNYTVRGSGIFGQDEEAFLNVLGTLAVGSGTAAGTFCLSGVCYSAFGNSVTKNVTNTGSNFLVSLAGTHTTGDVVTFDASGSAADGGALGAAAFKGVTGAGLGTVVSLGAGSHPTGDAMAFDSNGSAVDGGVLGAAASKAVTGSGLGTLVSLGAGTHTLGDVATFDANGSLLDGGALGTAAFKAVSASGQGTLASVSGATTANHLLSAADSNGTVKDAGTPGSVVSVNMPTPSPTQLGGAYTVSCGTGSYVTTLANTGTLSCGTPGLNAIATQTVPAAGIAVSNGTSLTTSISHTAKTSSAPVITGSTSVTLGTCSNTGTYEQLGSIVFDHGSLSCTVSSLTGTLQVSLPIASASDGIPQAVSFTQIGATQSWPTTVATQLVGRIPPSSAFFYIEGNKNASGATPLSSSSGCTAGCVLNLNFTAVYDTGSGS